ncbi:phage major capsid protein [Desulfuromonas thiophila]|uniref:phage major capsid protein n=1 Tax=Desulfuromonas thiophila TaxID=57664 RepID=UPI0029F5831E|nr:phage major capsid protein [Desulfuromonas thiophila]
MPQQANHPASLPTGQNHNERYLPQGMQFRSFSLRVDAGGKPASLDEATRSVEVVAATENPVRVFDRERWEVVEEVLLMSGCQLPENRQVVLLDSHWRGGVNSILGSCRGLAVKEGNQLIGRSHYSEASEAAGAWLRTREGHLTDYSAGYQVLESHWIPVGQRQMIQGRSFDGPLKVTTRWRIVELSACPIGADEQSKARAAHYQPGTPVHPPVHPPQEREMPNTNEENRNQAPESPPAQPQGRSVETPDSGAIVAQERQRAAEIGAIGRQFAHVPGVAELCRQFVDNGQGVDACRAAVMEKLGGQRAAGKIPEPIGDMLSGREDQHYSLVRALNVAAYGGNGFEREVSDQIAKQLGRSTDGIFIPTSLRAAAVVGAAGQGGHTVPTIQMPIIELLRNKMMVKRLGAQVLSGLTGDLKFPRQEGTAALNWTGENPGSNTAATDMTDYFGQVLMAPKSAIATIPYSKQLLAQSSLDIENFFRTDLARVNALGLDLAAINGAGGSQPTGILSTTGIGAVVGGDNGALPDRQDIIDLETRIAALNADEGAMAYLTNAKVRGLLKNTETATGSGRFVWGDGVEKGFGLLNGYRAAVSNQVPSTLTKGTASGLCSAIIFGNWEDLLIGEWGVIEIIIDPYSLKKQGLVEMTSTMLCDVAVRQPQSFAAMKDALTA